MNQEVDEHTSWRGPNPLEPDGAEAAGALLELQAEVVEMTRLAALKAGAKRVIVSSNGVGGGIDVEAVFGEDVGQDGGPGRPLPDVD